MNIQEYIQRLALALVVIAGFLVKAAIGMSLPVTEFTLDNGMNIIVIEDHRSPVVMQAVVYKVGSADEETGKTGLAHFFEHLMFKGTTKYPKNSIDLLLDENGAERNAYTTLETTVYFTRAKADMLETLMSIESDRMQNLVLTPEVLETERKVVQEERRMRMESDPFGAAFERMNATTFKTHPYGRPIIGAPEDVANLSLDDANRFYRAHYMPSNAILLVVGDVKPADVNTLAQAYFGPVQNRVVATRAPRKAEALPTTAERLEMQDARVTDTTLFRTYNMGPNAGITPREAAANAVLASILGSNSQSRLIKQLVTRDSVATTVNTSYRGSTDEIGLFYVIATPRSTVDVSDLERRIDIMLQDVKTNGVTQLELQDAVNTAAAIDIYARDSAVSLGTEAAEVLASGRDIKFIDEVSAALVELKSADIQAAAQKVFDANRSVTLIMRPKS